MRLAHEVGKFGVVGVVAYVVDVGLYNVMRFGFDLDPYTSKIISTIAAIAVAYVGNRHWTWRGRSHHGIGRESLMFLLVNAGGLLIGLACLGFTVHVLGLHGRLAENIAANVVGTILGTMFRFWAYRTWVFPNREGDAPIEDALEKTTVTPY